MIIDIQNNCEGNVFTDVTDKLKTFHFVYFFLKYWENVNAFTIGKGCIRGIL